MMVPVLERGQCCIHNGSCRFAQRWVQAEEGAKEGFLDIHLKVIPVHLAPEGPRSVRVPGVTFDGADDGSSDPRQQLTDRFGFAKKPLGLSGMKRRGQASRLG